MTKKEVGIRFGCLCPTIEEQLKEQEIEFIEDRFKLKDLENFRTYIHNLFFAGFITDAEANRAFQRMIKYLGKHCKPKETTT